MSAFVDSKMPNDYLYWFLSTGPQSPSCEEWCMKFTSHDPKPLLRYCIKIKVTPLYFPNTRPGKLADARPYRFYALVGKHYRLID